MNENIETKKIKNSWIKKFIKFFLLILVFLGLFFYLYIRYFEPKMVIVNEKSIIDSNLPESFNGFKIVHFSDIFYGSSINDKELKKIVKKINELKPDVIVYTGDLFNNTININDENIENIKNILKNTEAKFKKYAIIGDSDYINKDKYLEIMNGANFTFLDNEDDFIYYKGNDPLQFVGTSSILGGENNIDKFISKNLNDPEYFQIWLNHEPIIIDNLLDNEIHPNILLTGHTLYGIVNFPFMGYLLKLDGISKYTNDFYHKKRINMFVSNGLGTYKYNIRFMNIPSINFYRLYNN